MNKELWCDIRFLLLSPTYMIMSLLVVLVVLVRFMVGVVMRDVVWGSHLPLAGRVARVRRQ